MAVRYVASYQPPLELDELLMASDGTYLNVLGFASSAGLARYSLAGLESAELPVFRETRRWLDCYFRGREPGFLPPYHIEGLTDFRREVLELLLEIPFGETTTYGALAAKIARRRGMAEMSAQAVGGAVGWNPLCILIPCHRVIGADGGMTGYGGGLGNKVALLRHEALYSAK